MDDDPKRPDPDEHADLMVSVALEGLREAAAKAAEEDREWESKPCIGRS
jgi:hypothetical protein